jgi:phosphatidylglycerophosphate synthase
MVAASAAGASFVIALLDGVDGWLARRTRMSSAFGARFDMETDALLVLVLAVLTWQYGKAGVWVVMSGLLRYLFVAASWLFPWIGRPLPASRRGRMICLLQVVTLSVAILPAIAPPLSTILAAGGLLALTYSFAVDTLWLWRHASSSDAIDRVRDNRSDAQR